MNSKQQIAKILIIFGFIISIADFGLSIVSFYTNDNLALVIEEVEDNSEPMEKEGSENEDIKENDKISQFYNPSIFESCAPCLQFYPDISISSTSVYLDSNTPPPEV